jgi:hypothetical protein
MTSNKQISLIRRISILESQNKKLRSELNEKIKENNILKDKLINK